MKHLKLKIFLSLTALMCMFSCGTPYYISGNFDDLTADHQSIAILPFDMFYTGKMPEKLTQEQLDQVSAGESKAFQISFFNLLLRSTKRGKKAMRVDVQHFDRTNKILEDNGIAIKDINTIEPERLCSLLKVDAVVKCRVEKHRLMSDLASYGIDIGVEIINVLSNYALWPFIPGRITASKAVRSSYSLLDGESGVTLWSTSYETEADWSASSNEIIEHVIAKSVKKFPYRL